jgi:hypothetical protein
MKVDTTKGMRSLLKDISEGKYNSSIRKNDIDNFHDLEALVEFGYLKAVRSSKLVNPEYFDIKLTSIGFKALEDTQSTKSEWTLPNRLTALSIVVALLAIVVPAIIALYIVKG